MAYGRLEVYFPDGRLETYMLHEDNVSVGRADGNVIELDTDTISRYHFSIMRQDNQATITDLGSANGTFVDGVQLASDTPHLLGDVEEILVGSLRIIYRQVDDSPTVMMTTLDEETQQMEVSGSQVRIELDYTRLKVWPASNSSTELAITNLATETRAFTINVTGLPTGWLRLTRPEVELDANETAYILINVKPPRRPNTVPKHYEVTIEVAPTGQPSLATYTQLDVEIKAYRGFGMAIGQQPDVDEPVPVFLHNQGSGTMRFSIKAVDRNNALLFKGQHNALELSAGQRMRIDLQVEGKSPALVGQTQTYPFIVEVQSLDASYFVAASEGQATIGPRIPLWGAVALVGIAFSILSIGLLAILGLLSPTDPIIRDMTVPERVDQGDELSLMVDLSRTDSYDVLLNQSVVASDVDGSVDTVTIMTDNAGGNVEITVIARNGSRTTRQTTTSYIYVPLNMARFEVTPNPLVRNTVNDISISWVIDGAIFVKITGLDAFTNNLFDASTEYSAADGINGIVGIPTEPLTLTITAEDELGNTLEEQRTISLVDPQCIAMVNIDLYEGPDTRYQQVATIPVGEQVIVLSQDADAGWLRVRLSSELDGWGQRETLDCADNFDLSSLRVEANIPDLPTPIASPPATITPIPLSPTPDDASQ